MAPRAIIAGGSMGGLFAAAALRRIGWRADVFEKTPVELSGRGAGIVTHRELVAAMEEVGASTEALGVEVLERVAFDRRGEVVARLPYPQVVTSWDRLHQSLRAITPDDSHHLGREVTGYREMADGVEVIFADGSREHADILVGADGFRSAVRAQLWPKVQPIYSGYVVWRALTPEAAIPPELRESVFPYFGLYCPAGTQIVGYPIPGPKNDLRPGHRRYNFVWYVAAPEGELAEMLTDAEGRRHALTVPPPLVREELIAEALRAAEETLPRAFVEILAHSERPFFTPIYDFVSPAFASARVALVGDAACVARPHVGMGVTKAAEDALSLARHLSSDLPVDEAFSLYSSERQPQARRAMEIGRRLGSYVFAPDPERRNRDGRHHPMLDRIMRETAVVPGRM